MFKLNSKIDNVRDYVIYKGKPYYINTSDEIQCGEKKQMLYKTPLSPLVTFNGKFYCSEWENNYKIFDENLELIEEGKDKAFLYLSKEFLETYFLDEQQKIFITALLDREENLMVLGDIDRSAISVFSNEYIYIYIYKKNKIYDDVMSIRAFSIQKKEHLWEFSLASFGKWKNSWDEERYFKVYKLIGIYNNIFWAFIELGGFVGLDIETGELKYRIPEYDQAIGKTICKGKDFFRSDYFLNSEKRKILGMAMDVFIEIDLTQEPPFVTQYGLQEEFEKYNIKKANDTATDYVVQDDLLYFSLFNQLRFGILDINTKEIIYISDPIAVVERDDCFTQLKDLKVSENKVYILDSNHTLHIFEREE
ncbi:hypothetical protein [Capnocytophaga sp. oral taxon 903]|uniref:hypothetical protein n=1 Tax=Capnocytophaga sp. oral taxon 903 TaxID=2748317 RepID=UPI0021030EDD|nr:hypothetical protein [Capnocytophaga sp. oral taxon 903]